MNIITRASVKERIHVEQIIRSQPRMHNSDLVDIVTIPVRKCLGLSMDVYKPVGEFKEPLPIILDVHGGGLIAGRKEQNRNLGIQLARGGYIVFIPDYRLVPETDIFGQISDIEQEFRSVVCGAWLSDLYSGIHPGSRNESVRATRRPFEGVRCHPPLCRTVWRRYVQNVSGR